MWRRAATAWAVAACGCSFEALDIRLAAPPDGGRSCTPTAPGCGQARIAGGSFAMGDPMAFDSRGAGNRAVPVQPSITVSTFMLDRYEVTVARFRRFVTATARTTGAGFDVRTGSSNYCNWTAMPVDREGHPMNCVDWQTAMEFCAWDTSDGTLPSEAQWEYAARGSTNRPWPWGGPDGGIPDGRVCWNHFSPTPLGTCLEEDPSNANGATPSPESVWHLVGNVWEWTRDWYAPYPETTCWNRQVRVDPRCMGSAGESRSIRGGSWNYDNALYLRSGARLDNPPTDRDVSVGFRCAGTAR